MALNIKNREVERLAAEVAELAHETKTEAIRRALEDRRMRLKADLAPDAKVHQIQEYLQTYIWPLIPEERRGKKISKDEIEDILGYGPHGV